MRKIYCIIIIHITLFFSMLDMTIMKRLFKSICHIFQSPEALHNARMLLSTMAVYIDQARQDEANRKGDPSLNMTPEIRLIEELGIYHLLCNLQSSYYNQQLNWENTLEQDLIDPGCRELNEMAPIDNRNYIIFYALDKLLHGLTQHFTSLDSRRKKWRHALKYGFRYDR